METPKGNTHTGYTKYNQNKTETHKEDTYREIQMEIQTENSNGKFKWKFKWKIQTEIQMETPTGNIKSNKTENGKYPHGKPNKI